MELVTTDGKQTVTKITPCTSRKTGKTVWLYETKVGTYVSTKRLPNNANVEKALTDAFG